MKKYTLAVVAIAATVAVSSTAYAEKPLITGQGNVNVKVQVGSSTQSKGNATSTHTTSTKTQGNATSTAAKNKQATTTESHGKLMSTSHRSAVATFVQSLHALGNRQGGIGPEVREIARKQNDSATTTASAIAHVEKRGGVKTFFWGDDYTNLKAIRSELATTTSNIARLNAVLEKTTDAGDRLVLSTEIKALEAELAKIQAFVTAREKSFSLFGWATKMFAK